MKDRPRARDLGIEIGFLPPGPNNAIIDVPGVRVGHVSLTHGNGSLVPGDGPVRTGVTAILPHGKNMFEEKVCAAIHVINGYGKSLGLVQVQELGALETPILLTGTLNVWTVADALVDFLIRQTPDIGSVNPVVGECNDGFLNDIQGRHVRREHVFEALGSASEHNVEEGCVGAGVGMTGFGWKGGIGTASRTVEDGGHRYTVGALVLTNTGSAGELRINGFPLGKHLRPDALPEQDGSIMIILATDTPVSSRQLGRIARRAGFGLARIGGTAHHGSGDFVIAFSTATRISPAGTRNISPDAHILEPHISPFFTAAVDATEEAILNSLLRARTLVGRDGNTRHAIPIDRVESLIRGAGQAGSH